MIELYIYIKVIYFFNLSCIYISGLYYKMLSKYGLVLSTESSKLIRGKIKQKKCNTGMVVCWMIHVTTETVTLRLSAVSNALGLNFTVFFSFVFTTPALKMFQQNVVE